MKKELRLLVEGFFYGLGLVVILILLFTCPSYGASFVACATGNWTNQNTWNVDGAGCGVTASHPDSLDTVTIGGNYTVTLNESHNIGTTTIENGTLIIGSGYKATTNGSLIVGNGTSKDGTLTFSAGSELEHGTNDVKVNNCTVNTTGVTQESHRIWINKSSQGSGAWIYGTITYPKQVIDLKYMTFMNTGEIRFRICGSGGTGGLTSSFSANHCVFYGCGQIVIGYTPTYPTPLTTNITFDYCDFIDCVGTTNYVLTLQMDVGLRSGNYWFKNCTFNNTLGVEKYLRQLTVNYGLIIDSCVFYNYVFSFVGQALEVTNNFFYKNIVTTETMIIWTTTGSDISYNLLVKGNYFLPDYSNPVACGSGRPNSTYTNSIIQNVFESKYSAQSTVVGASGTGKRLIKNNVLIGAVEGLYATLGDITGDIDLDNNTVLWAWNGSKTYTLWFSHTYDMKGTSNVRNNAHDYYGSFYEGVVLKADAEDAIMVYDDAMNSGCIAPSNPYPCCTGEDTGTCDQVLNQVGWNYYNALLNPYQTAMKALFVDDKTSNDKDLSAKFLYPIRFGNGTTDYTSLAKYNKAAGSGTQTDAAAITYMLGLNGYRGSPNYDQGGSVSRPPRYLVEWIRDAFSPTNGLFRKAGYDGSTIGAMEWQNPRRKRGM